MKYYEPPKTYMKLENQVTSLELSKKLKELGVKQESLFYWESYYLPITTSRHNTLISSKDIGAKEPVERRGFLVSKLIRYSAFTVAELGEMLPASLKMKMKEWRELNLLPKQKIRKYDGDNNKMYFQLIMSKSEYKKTPWSFYYMEDITHGACINNSSENTANTEANARAKMVIYLKENNLLK